VGERGVQRLRVQGALVVLAGTLDKDALEVLEGQLVRHGRSPIGCRSRSSGSAGARTTRAALNPPWPRASTRAARTGSSRGEPRPGSSRWWAAGRSTCTVAGTTRSRIDSSAATTSSGGPPAQSRPVIVFGTVTGTPYGPKTSAMAAASTSSSAGTAAAAGETTAMAGGGEPAAARAGRAAAGGPAGAPAAGGGAHGAAA